ncbi:MAG: hypothetical protein KA354_25090 [Phycisphaerae bacterium]|nr:hypothetical protein [Phycisphaerae bacterium]
MPYCKGQITRIRQCSGCVEVTVAGEASGCFPIDNCCFAMMVGADGAELLGRRVEYSDDHMRFLDECAEDPPAPIPFPLPSCSSGHI